MGRRLKTTVGWSKKTQLFAAEVRAQALREVLGIVRETLKPMAVGAVTEGPRMTKEEANALMADLRMRLEGLLCNYRLKQSRRPIETVWLKDRDVRKLNGTPVRPLVIKGIDMVMHASSVTNRSLALLGIPLRADHPLRQKYETLAVKRMHEGMQPAELVEIVQWAVRQRNSYVKRLVVLWGREATSYLSAARTSGRSRGSRAESAVTETLRKRERDLLR